MDDYTLSWEGANVCFFFSVFAAVESPVLFSTLQWTCPSKAHARILSASCVVLSATVTWESSQIYGVWPASTHTDIRLVGFISPGFLSYFFPVNSEEKVGADKI